jgi:signal transduction histidine kinase/integral membrane sensor domain MASE1
MASGSSFQRSLLWFGFIVLLIYFAAQLSLSILQLKLEASPIWLPAGIAIAALAGRGLKFWIAVAIAFFLFNHSTGASPGLVIGASIGSTLQAMVGATLLQRFRVNSTFDRVRDVLLFVSLAVLLTPCVNATISTAAADLTNLPLSKGLAYNWWTLWLGDGMGILTLTPLLLRWQSVSRWQSKSVLHGQSGGKFDLPFGSQFGGQQRSPASFSKPALRSTQLVEQGICFLSLLLLSSIVFYAQIDAGITEYPLEYLPFPLVIWAALRFGQSRAIWASLLLSAIAISGTIFRRGPFVVKDMVLQQQILLLQAFIAVVIITALVVAATATERDRSSQSLRQIVERDRLLQEITLSIRKSLDIDEIMNTTVDEVRRMLGCDRVFFARFDTQGQGEMVAESVLPGWRPTLGLKTEAAHYPAMCDAFAVGTRVTDDLSLVEQRPFFKHFHSLYEVRAAIGIPIVEAGQMTGFLAAHQCSDVRHWQDWEVEILERLVTPISIAIQQGELYRQVRQLNSNLEQQVAERTEALQQSLREQESMSQVQDVLFHAIAHDLRTTLIGTIMTLKSLESQPGETVALRRMVLDRMIQSSDTQITKLNHLLEVYQNRTEGVVIYPQPFCMKLLLESLLDQLSPLFVENQTILSLHTSMDTPPVSIDIDQMQRVLTQLLINAVKHNPPKTTVTIELQAQSNQLTLAIADNGRGMTAKECDRLFDLRLHGSPNEKQLTGIHIGLYFCEQVMTAHQGKIAVESAVGEGSRFQLTLPVYEGIGG